MGEKKKLLTVDDILNACDIEAKDVYVPQWGGIVKVKPFTKHQQQHARKKAMVGGEFDSDRFEMILFTEGVVEPKFTEEQIEALSQKNAAAMDAVIKVITAEFSVTPEDEKEATKLFRAK